MVMVLPPKNESLHAALVEAFTKACRALNLERGVDAVIVTAQENDQWIVQLVSPVVDVHEVFCGMSAIHAIGVTSNTHIPAAIATLVEERRRTIDTVPVFSERKYSDDLREFLLIDPRTLCARSVRGAFVSHTYRA